MTLLEEKLFGAYLGSILWEFAEVKDRLDIEDEDLYDDEDIDVVEEDEQIIDEEADKEVDRAKEQEDVFYGDLL